MVWYRVVATVIGTAIVIGTRYIFFQNYVVYKSVGKQKYRHVFLTSLYFGIARVCKILYIKLIY